MWKSYFETARAKGLNAGLRTTEKLKTWQALLISSEEQIELWKKIKKPNVSVASTSRMD